MEESIQDELLQILSDLEKISDLVALKESELGLVKTLFLERLEDGYFELHLDDKSFFLDANQLKTLRDDINAQNV